MAHDVADDAACSTRKTMLGLIPRWATNKEAIMARKPKLGTGKRFSKLVNKLKGKVKNPRAVAAAIGRKKFGKKKMTKLASAGRKRRAKKS